MFLLKRWSFATNMVQYMSYAPQSNGVAKRKNGTLLDMVNDMLLSSDLPNIVVVKRYILFF